MMTIKIRDSMEHRMGREKWEIDCDKYGGESRSMRRLYNTEDHVSVYGGILTNYIQVINEVRWALSCLDFRNINILNTRITFSPGKLTIVFSNSDEGLEREFENVKGEKEE